MKKYKWIILILVLLLLIPSIYFLKKEEPYISIGDYKNSSDGKYTSIIGTRNGKQFIVTGKKESKEYDEITYFTYASDKLLYTSKNNSLDPFHHEEYIIVDGVEFGPYSHIKELDIAENGDYSYITEKVVGSANNTILTKDTLIYNGKESASYDKIQHYYVCNGNNVFKALNNNEEFMVINWKEGPHYKKIEGFDHNNGCLPNGDIIYLGERKTPKWTTGTGTSSEYTEYRTSFDFLKNDTVIVSNYKSMMNYGLNGNWGGGWFVTNNNHFAVPLEIENEIPMQNSKWQIMVDGVVLPKVYDAVFAVQYTDDGTLKYGIIENNLKDWVSIPPKN